MPTAQEIRKDAELVIDVCMSVEPDDVVTIICDNEHRVEADALAEVAVDRGAWPVVMDNEMQVRRGRAVRTHMKLVVDSKTDKVLGCHIFGDHAAEIIQVAAVALKLGATKADFDGTIALHPTAAEELVTMRTKSYSKTPADLAL